MELSVRYADLVDTKVRAILALKDGIIFNNRYEGNAKAGAVKVRKTGAAVVQEYDRINGVNMTRHDSEYIDILVNKDNAVNEQIDGYEAAAVPDNMIADRLDDATYGLALTLDIDGAAELVTGGTTFGDTTAITADTAYDVAVDARTTLSKLGVPNDGRRYMLVSPDAYASFLKSPEFIKASSLGDAVVQTGAIGRIAGFNVYESANLGDGVEFIAGHPNYATRVNEWHTGLNVIDVKDGKHIGCSAIQGRKVYAHKVTNADAILVKKSA